jgi:hypothetical protein
VGRDVFRPAVEAIGGMLQMFADEGKRPYLRGAVLVMADGERETHGETDERYDRRTGAMLNAVIHLPRAAGGKFAWAIVAHEFGHALGLAHAPGLMAESLSSTDPPLAEFQRRALAATYGAPHAL